MFPIYKLRSAPSRSRDGARRCCRNTKPRPRWRTIRQSAAVKFKIYLKTRCSPSPVSDSNALVSPKIQSQPSEALSVIGQHDSPREGLALLPEIVAQLDKLRETNDYASINGVLASVNSLFMKFRDTFHTNDLFVDLKYCLDNFAKPLFELFKQTSSMIDHTVDSGAAANALILIRYMESQRLCCSIFYSLNFQELSEFFKDNMSEWMFEFNKYIKLRVPALEYGLALAELRAAVCENLSLYVMKEDELFQGYLIDFVGAVLNLLISSSSSQGREQVSVTITAIKFLTAVSKSSHHILFSKDPMLHLIYKSIVIPHLVLHDVDEELFEINPVEFIRKDMEGRDIDPIRRIACELFKGIATHYKDKVVRVLFRETASCFHRFNGDPKGNWKYMYSAFCLAISLATENAAAVGTSVSTDILNVEDFYFDFISEQLKIKDLDVTSFPMIQAVSLKFMILFRSQLSELDDLLVLLLPNVTRLLTSPHYVVHSYAAWCIDELFLVKDDSDWFSCYSYRVLWLSDAGYTLSTLMSNLFGALSFPESEENLYVMKCIMRVVSVGDLTADVASLCIEGLTTILQKVCQNPKNALFNHYLFESLIGLIRRVCFLSKEVNERPRKEEISLASLLENKLYPCLQNILARDISEFFTYAFRLLAELVDLNRPLLPEDYYSQVFDILHLPDTWMDDPAKGFLPHELNFPSHVIYSKLVSSSAIKDQGYYVLNTVIENLGFEVISPFVSHIWVSLFNRLQNQRAIKSVKNIIVFMSLFLLKDDPKNFVSSVNTEVQPNAFQAILEQFWIPNLKLITDPIELKLTTCASTRLMCESPDIFDIRLRGKMLDSIITLPSRTVDDEPGVQEFGETIGVYNAATFTPLYDSTTQERKRKRRPFEGN